MSTENATGYLPGDPRYGLQGETLRDYYRTKPAQWAIYCWDRPAMADTRRALVAAQQSYVKTFRTRFSISPNKRNGSDKSLNC